MKVLFGLSRKLIFLTITLNDHQKETVEKYKKKISRYEGGKYCLFYVLK